MLLPRTPRSVETIPVEKGVQRSGYRHRTRSPASLLSLAVSLGRDQRIKFLSLLPPFLIKWFPADLPARASCHGKLPEIGLSVLAITSTSSGLVSLSWNLTSGSWLKNRYI